MRSLVPKIDLLRVWVNQYKPDIITLSETWLTNKISNNEIELTNYVLHRADRGLRGGGVATFVLSNLASEVITPEIEPSNFECLFVKVILHENKYITIGNIYRPPSAPADSFDCMISTINSISCKNEIVILGDFNKNWLDNSSKKIKSTFGNLNLTQLINEPTRVTPFSQSLLDWILVSHPQRFLQSGVLSDCMSDHSIVYCIWKIKFPKLPPKLIKIRQYKKMNVNKFSEDLVAINWDRYQLIPDVQNAWEFFYSEIIPVINKHAPFKTVKVKGRHLPWVSSDLISIFRQRDNSWAKFRKTKDPVDWEQYRHLRNKSKTMTRNAKSNYFKESLDHDFKNPKQFWKTIKSVTNVSDKPPLNQIRNNNIILKDPFLIAQAFNNHFSSVCSALISNPSSSDAFKIVSPPRNSCVFSFRKITPAEVQDAINELKVSSGPGLDGIESKFLRLSSHVLMFPLCDLFNLSLATCDIPAIWKCSRITPLHKGGDALEPNNYRPISIICSIAKVFEKLIYNQLSSYLNRNNILSPYQSGFRSNHSTSTALLKLTNDIFCASNDSKLTGAIFIDLTKAFDLVDHYLLLDKLYSIGLSRNALLWFNSYLHNRKQCVVIQGSKSDTTIQQYGVPQGSTLGPLLFSIFINDLSSFCSDCCVQLYADDTVLYISQTDTFQIQSALQSGFNSLQHWLAANKLLLNKTKSHTMIFGTQQNIKTKFKSSSYMITCLDGTPLKKVEHIKYLGLWLDCGLSFKYHIDHTVKKLNFSLSVLYRSKNCFSFAVRKRLASQLILPILDYADVVYMVASKTNLHPLNTVYNKLCRFILGCPFTTHHCTMYETLHFLSPNIRRQLHWYHFIFKCIHFNYPLYLKHLFVPVSSHYNLRHASQIFFSTPTVSKSVGKKAFKFKAPSDWNNLPGNIRSISSFPVFKNTLSSYYANCCNCFN